jgi:two-component system sensor histidine kinase ChvG
VSVKIALVLVMFATVPVLVYDQFRAANDETNQLLVGGVEAQGRLIAEALRPGLGNSDGATLAALARTVQQLGAAGPEIKLLFRPEATGGAFFYVASSPVVPAAYLERERQELVRLGVLDRLDSSCAQAGTAGFRYTNPVGAVELLTSITAIRTEAGCWVVITADHSAAALGSALGQPYWKTAAVGTAAAIYMAMAAGVLILLLQVWFGLGRFARLARSLRVGSGGSFAAANRIPELAGVAAEFDRLVDALRASAEALRFTAQETAHAFKTPLGIIAQSLEPLRRRVGDDGRGQRSLELIDRALDRLDGLVSAARALDETLADTINPSCERIALSALVADIVSEYREAYDPAGIRFSAVLEADCFAMGASALIETMVENLLDNAVSFSPVGATVEIGLRSCRGVAELSVADQGPGVAPETLEHIFNRFVSLREGQGPPGETAFGGKGAKGVANLGLGLWIVRRNVEVMGGVVAAENRADGGFRVVVALPLAP